MALSFDNRNLPDDPRDNGFVDAHGPGGRMARVQEVEDAFRLTDPETGDTFAMPRGGFIVWEDGVYRAVTREEFLDDAWDVDLGQGVPSVLQSIEDTPHPGDDPVSR